jgi:hypothetical protein
MVACDRLTFAGLQARIGAFTADHGPFEHSMDRHGVWVEDRDTAELGRIAYEIVDGPILALWADEPEVVLPDSPLFQRLWEMEKEHPHIWGMCHPDSIKVRGDLAPVPWYGIPNGSGWSVESLLSEVGISEIGVVRWGTAVPLDAPGIYVVALTNDPSRTNTTLPWAPIGDMELTELLEVCDELRIDGQRPDTDELRGRISSFWLGDQTVLYAGKANSSVRRRVDEYYRTPLGARSPHAGGWFLKTLGILDELFVHFGSSRDPEATERHLLEAFIASIPPEIRDGLPDPDPPLPFANLRLPGNGAKGHGITGATGCA